MQYIRRAANGRIKFSNLVNVSRPFTQAKFDRGVAEGASALTRRELVQSKS
jgi:hypothetical protein